MRTGSGKQRSQPVCAMEIHFKVSIIQPIHITGSQPQMTMLVIRSLFPPDNQWEHRYLGNNTNADYQNVEVSHIRRTE